MASTTVTTLCSSGMLCQSKFLPESPITRAVLSEVHEVLEMWDFEKLLICFSGL
jgi:hypothetical protein